MAIGILRAGGISLVILACVLAGVIVFQWWQLRR